MQAPHSFGNLWKSHHVLYVLLQVSVSAQDTEFLRFMLPRIAAPLHSRVMFRYATVPFFCPWVDTGALSSALVSGATVDFVYIL